MDLHKILETLPIQTDPAILVGSSTFDDGGVYKLSDDVALIQTLDFFPPIVDDPYDFGQIAVTNALSDVYAMGGKPITAMNIVCYPMTDLGPEALAMILKGGVDKLKEAGVALLGGHSVKDKELKYGISVTGRVHPDRILSNAKAQTGDLLILTKPLGTGILTTALKKEMLNGNFLKKATTLMKTLNASAMEVALRCGVTTCTDITGFGLAGHLAELAEASGVAVKIDLSSIPILSETFELIRKGVSTSGGRANKEHLSGKFKFTKNSVDVWDALVFDPQTSGGLLLAVSEHKAFDCVQQLKEAGLEESSIIGEVIPQNDPLITFISKGGEEDA